VSRAVLDVGGSVVTAICGREEADLDVETPGTTGAEGEVGAVGGGDGLDDGQAEPEAVAVPCPVGGEALERLEQAAELIWGHDGSGVGHFQADPTALAVDEDVDVPAGKVVVQGVVDQVPHEAFDKVGVAGKHSRANRHIEAHLLRGGSRLAGVDYFRSDDGQVEGLALVEASLAAGEGEQRVDELFFLFAGFEHV